VDKCDCGRHLTVGRATKAGAHPFTRACGKPFGDIATRWPDSGIVLTPEENKSLVEQKILRVNVRYRETGKRIKPYNHYAIVDHLLRIYRNHEQTDCRASKPNWPKWTPKKASPPEYANHALRVKRSCPDSVRGESALEQI